MSKEVMLTITQVAEQLGLTPDCVYNHILKGNLEAYAFGGHRKYGERRRKVGAYRISQSQFEKFKGILERKKRGIEPAKPDQDDKFRFSRKLSETLAKRKG